MYESEIIAARIKKTAKDKGITLSEVFANCELGRNTMANLKSGRSFAHDSLAKVADYLGVTTDYLLGRDTESHRVALLAPKDYDQLTEEERDFINSTVEAVLKNRKKTE